MPQAIKFMQRSAQDLVAIDPKYFDRFHASAETKSASKAIDRYPFLCLYHAFIQHENFHHENIARGSFSRAVCLQLHQTEAKVLHELKRPIWNYWPRIVGTRFRPEGRSLPSRTSATVN